MQLQRLARSPRLIVPERMRPKASNAEQSDLGNSLAMCTTSGPAGLHARMCSAMLLSCGPVYKRSTWKQQAVLSAPQAGGKRILLHKTQW
jgi:hypothetical protein